MTQSLPRAKTIPKLFGERAAQFRSVSTHLTVAMAGGIVLIAASWLQNPAIINSLLLMGSGLLTYGVGRTFQQVNSTAQTSSALSPDAVALMMRDVSAVLVAQDTGAIVQMNPAAAALFSDVHPDQQGNIAQLFSKFTASPAALIARLTARAQASGYAHD